MKLNTLQKIILSVFSIFISYYFTRWLILLIIVIPISPLFFLFGLIKINTHHIIYPFYSIEFPLFTMNPHLENYYKYIYVFLKTQTLILAFVAGFVFVKKIWRATKLTSGYFTYRDLSTVIKLYVFVIIAIFGFIVFLVPPLFLPGYNFIHHLSATTNESRNALAFMKRQEWNLAKASFSKAEVSLTKAQVYYKRLYWLEGLPLLNIYKKDLNHGFSAVNYGIKSVIILNNNLATHFNNNPVMFSDTSFTQNQNSFYKVLEFIPTFQEDMPQFFDLVESLIKEVNSVDEKHYPLKLGNYEIRNNILKIKEYGVMGSETTTLAREILPLLPNLLGKDKERTYLLVFQNEKDLTSNGGYLVSYGTIKLKDGKFFKLGSNDIDNILNKNSKPWRETERSAPPDFALLSKNYFFNDPTGNNLDGVISINGRVLENIIKISGPFVINNQVFSLDENHLCSCPSLVYSLQNMAKNEKKEIIGNIFNGFLLNLQNLPRQSLVMLSRAILTSAQEKHVLIYMKDPIEQKAVESLNLSGSIRNSDSDYLYINNSSLAQSSAFLYVKYSVKQEIEITKDKSIFKKITIEYQNPSPEDCDKNKASHCLNSKLSNMLRIYVPHGSSLIDADPAFRQTAPYDQFNKTVFTAKIDILPMGNQKYVLRYQLPFKLNKPKEYNILLQKQPGIISEPHEIFVNNHKLSSFYLTSDTNKSFSTIIP